MTDIMKLVWGWFTVFVWIYPIDSANQIGKLTTKHKCGQTIHITNNTKLSLSFVELNIHKVPDEPIGSKAKLCELEIKTDPGYLIKAIINYLPQKQSCDTSYLHIGNDPFRTNTKSLTSYMICNTSRDLEIVSRDNYMWLVHSHKPEVIPDVAEIHIEVNQPVTCNDTMFECSPVQCVPDTLVCDGNSDCQNGRDEYCINLKNLSKIDDKRSNARCFLCDDGTCILPELPRYHDDWGKYLWYLCDGVWHCKNGTDERMDMCFRTQKSSDLLQCVPFNSAENSNRSALMWPDRKCDGTQDCADNEDENECEDVSESGRIQPAAILLIVCSVLAVIIGFVICQIRIDKSEGSRGSRSQSNLASRYKRCYRGGSTDLLERTRLDTVTEEPEHINV